MTLRDDEIRAVFTTPQSDKVKRLAHERGKFEEWLKTVVDDELEFNDHFRSTRINSRQYSLAWEAWLAAKGLNQ